MTPEGCTAPFASTPVEKRCGYPHAMELSVLVIPAAHGWQVEPEMKKSGGQPEQTASSARSKKKAMRVRGGSRVQMAARQRQKPWGWPERRGAGPNVAVGRRRGGKRAVLVE